MRQAKSRTVTIRFPFPLPLVPAPDGALIPEKLLLEKFQLPIFEGFTLDYLIWKTYGENRLQATVSYDELSDWLQRHGKRPGGWRGCGKKPLTAVISNLERRRLLEILKQ